MTVELPGSDGRIIKRYVTKKWLDNMQSEGKGKRIEQAIVRVHMLHPSGYTLEHWAIGKNIDQAAVDQFRDVESGDVYAMTHFEKGEPQRNVVRKEMWGEPEN